MRSLLGEMTFHNLFVNVIWALIVAGLFRIVLKVFSIPKIRERLYWIVVPLLILFIVVISNETLHGYVDVRLTPEIFSIGALGGPPPNEALLAVVTVRNAGMPTVVEGWHLMVKWSNGETSNIPALNSPQVVLSNPPETFRKEDSLLLKTLTPIPTGGMVRGVLMYRLPEGRTEQDLRQSTATISAHDVFGNEQSINIPWNGSQSSMPVFPGLGEQP